MNLFRNTKIIKRVIKHLIKLLFRRPDSSWTFTALQLSVHSQTWKKHDYYLDWAGSCLLNASRIEKKESYLTSSEAAVISGYKLRQKVIEEYRGKYASLKNIRILIHLPESEVSPGGYSLFNNLLQSIYFLGVPARALEWNQQIENVLDAFKPTIFITSDHDSFLSKIDWAAVSKYRCKADLKIGLTASLEEYGNTPLIQRLGRARERKVDFYYSFKSVEYIASHQGYRPFFENGCNILNVEFGANPLLYYPIPNVERDINYVFLASSNQDKWPRYFSYLTKIFSEHSGFIDGPGWLLIKKWAAPPVHRYLYARGKIGINLHITNSIEWASELNERTYILAACGIPQLVDNAKLLPARFSDECFFIAKTPKEYYDMFASMLDQPEEAKRRALIAQQEVFSRHTTFHRAEKFITELSRDVQK